MNRLETNCRKSLIPFHAIWGLCWYNTSSWGVSVRRFCGFVAGRGGCHAGSRWRCLLVCVAVRVQLSHRVSLAVSSGVCRGQGSQIQDPSSHRVSLEV